MSATFSFTRLRELYQRRFALNERLQSENSFFRALHTTETQFFALDIARQVGILSLYAPLDPAQETELAYHCAQLWNLSSVYVKRRPAQASHLANVQRGALAPSQPLWGEAIEAVTAQELAIKYRLRPGGDLSIGLFGDARPARAWLRKRAAGRVLNTFAYTCGFGLNAALSGAQTVNIDLSRRVLDWGRENYALNGLDGQRHEFLYGDTFDWLRRLGKRSEKFDFIVLDPPSFARSKRGVWRSERDYPELVRAAAPLLTRKGQILALCNHAALTPRRFDTLLRASGLALAEALSAGEDYPAAEHLKVRALRRD